MRTAFALALSTLATGAITADARTDFRSAPRTGSEEVVITSVSPDPAAPSGILAVVVEVAGSVGGIETVYFIPYMTAKQAKPALGQKCRIAWQWHDTFDAITGYGRSVSEGRWVTGFSCDGVRRSAS